MTRLLLAIIRAYQRFVSPLLPRTCRFQPTCSAYAAQAIGRYGPWRGLWLATARLLRCHPFSSGGYDPVEPEPGQERLRA
ncbi:MAG: membrane protein insertion efficiency factor YidD [Armatimonadota bacterium]